MTVHIVFETHSISTDNEMGAATGWLPGRLSMQGRALAAELGRRRADDGLAAVFSSDLSRAAETASIAFGDTLPILLDWRLRANVTTASGTGACAARFMMTGASFASAMGRNTGLGDRASGHPMGL